MVKSIGFGSNTYNSFALFRLNFFTPPFVKLAIYINLLDPYAKGTLSQLFIALTACKFKISITLQCQFGCFFNFSFSVLLHYRLSIDI